MSNPTIFELLKTGLKAGGFDGLYSAEDECGCKLDDLCPCTYGPTSDCCAGYLGPPTEDMLADTDDLAEWRIFAEKQEDATDD